MKNITTLIVLGLSLVVFSSFRTNKSNDLIPFDSGVGRGLWTAEQQATALKQNGYSGIAYNYTNLAELKHRIKVMEENDLQIRSLYIGSTLGVSKDKQLCPEFEEVMETLEGKGIVVWLFMRKAKGVEGGTMDDEAVELIHKVSKLAKKYKLQVALYGHRWFYIETVEDSHRLAEKAKRNNVHSSFNLCHELMCGKEEELYRNIEKYAKKCLLVSINGANTGKKDIKDHIRPLYEGDLDLVKLVKALRKAGYKDPISQQCYQVKGDAYVNLRKNMTRWKEIISEL